MGDSSLVALLIMGPAGHGVMHYLSYSCTILRRNYTFAIANAYPKYSRTPTRSVGVGRLSQGLVPQMSLPTCGVASPSVKVRLTAWIQEMTVMKPVDLRLRHILLLTIALLFKYEIINPTSHWC